MLKEKIYKAKRTIYPAYAAVRGCMGRFAVRWFSLPLLILFAFGCFALVTHLEGYRLGGLKVSLYVYQFYLCDYSVGFCSRLLVGAVVTFFADVVSTDLMDVIINVSVILSLVLQAAAAGVILRIAMKRGSLLCCGIVLLFLCSPLAIKQNMEMPGHVDIYLLLLFLLWLACYRTPAVYWITPPLCLVGMAIHIEFFCMFLPPMLILLMYRAAAWEKKRARVCSAVSLAASSAVSAGSLIWFVAFANKHLKMTADEFYYRMLARFRTDPVTRNANNYRIGTPIFKPYFDAHLFGEGDLQLNAALTGKTNEVFVFNTPSDYLQFMFAFAKYGWNDWKHEIVVFIPIAVIMCLIWGICAVKEKGLKRFVFFCFAAQMLVLVPEVMVSTDAWRFITAAFISQFAVFFAVYYDEKSRLNRLLRL
ncbi:MAG: hypothetical protein IJK89_07525 [Clostridia bacterium]|nr:hypothetical protein [Clostridia bacterium]